MHVWRPGGLGLRLNPGRPRVAVFIAAFPLGLTQGFTCSMSVCLSVCNFLAACPIEALPTYYEKKPGPCHPTTLEGGSTYMSPNPISPRPPHLPAVLKGIKRSVKEEVKKRRKKRESKVMIH
ncbi:hypothetical protein DFP73DRAFT_544330 [Morchella snyderi]|nr:hypothetical protein DFP73DRAFT_544330 [Morchella snyderi]